MDKFNNPFGGFKGFGESSSSTNSGDLTSEELLILAQLRGGRIADVANEVAGKGRRSMLSSIGKTAKNAFTGLIDLISVPGQVVAGMISPEFTIAEAIKENKRVSDALFGSTNLMNPFGTPTTMQKVGDFLIRLPTDILTDPTTWLTFGTSSAVGLMGKMGLKSNSAISITSKTAKALGKNIDDGEIISRVLNDYGQDLFSFGKTTERSFKTLGAGSSNLIKASKAELIEKGIKEEVIDLMENNVSKLMKETMDSKFAPDFAKKAITNLFDSNPALAKEFLDGGGIKFFGKTILEAQRLSSVASLIPGMKFIDNVTAPFRDSANALFSNKFVKVNDLSYGEQVSTGMRNYTRIPEEFLNSQAQLRGFVDAKTSDMLREMDNVQKTFNLDKNQYNLLVANLSNNVLSGDPVLDGAYYAMKGIKENMIPMMKEAGVPISLLDNWVGLIATPNKTNFLNKARGSGQFALEPGATKQATNVKAIPLKTPEEIQKIPEVQKVLQSLGDNVNFTKSGDAIKDNIEFSGFNTNKVNRETMLGNRENFRLSTPENIEKFGLKNLNPDDTITVFRATDKEGISIGEQVTTSAEKANTYSKLRPNSTIKEIKVKVSDLVKSEGKIGEFVYAPASELRQQGEFSGLINKIKKAQSVEEVRDIIGKERDSLMNTLKKQGLSTDDALKNPVFKQLDDVQKLVKDFKTEGTLVGSKQTSELTLKNTGEIVDNLGLELDEISYFVDNENNIYKRTATTAQELKSVGIDIFDENLLTAWTIRSMKNIQQSLGQEFADGLVRNFGRWADEAPEGYIEMSSALVNDKAKEISKMFFRESDGMEMRFHPAIVKSFDELMGSFKGADDATKGFLQSYDKLQSYYKSYLTTIFPAFHGRNAFSNVLLNFMDIGLKALDPKVNYSSVQMIDMNKQYNDLMLKATKTSDEGVKALSEIDALLSKKMFTDRTGQEWTFGELQSVVKNNNIAFNGNTIGHMDVLRDSKELLKAYNIGVSKKEQLAQKFNLFNPDKFAPTKFGREFGEIVEQQARLTNFFTNLIDTGDVMHASSRTKQFLFDYQYGLSNFEKTVMRRLIPFYTFTRFNLELQAKTILKRPGVISTQIKGMQSLGDLLGGEPMTKEERDRLPDWLQTGLNIKRRRDDGKYEVISGFGTPLEQPFQLLTPSGFLGQLSPLAKTPIEQISGYNLYQGKATSDVTWAKHFRFAPEPIKDFIGYVEFEGKTKDGKPYISHHSLRPGRMQLLLSMPYARIGTTVSTVADENVSTGLKFLNFTTGIKGQSFEDATLEANKENELQKDLEWVLKTAGIRGQFTRGFNLKNTIKEN